MRSASAHVESLEAQTQTQLTLRRAFTEYQITQMAPLVRGLSVAAIISYSLLMLGTRLSGGTPAYPWVCVAVLILLMIIASYAFRIAYERSVTTLAIATITCLEIGISLHGFGSPQGLTWILPAFILLPLASSPVWLGPWPFMLAMAVVVFAPIPAVVLLEPTRQQLLAFVIYMGMSILCAGVVHFFLRRILHKHFSLALQLREQAHTDGLTGLLARNRFYELATQAVASAQQSAEPISALYLDADHFKRLNDSHGHAFGDQVLVALANNIRLRLRPDDILGRVGGEEFAMVLPGLELDRAMKVAERLRHAANNIRLPDGSRFSICVGVAQNRADERLGQLLEDADAALRIAKKCGRDRVELYTAQQAQ